MVIVAMIASILPFFNSGIRVFDVTSTKIALPSRPKICSVIALAISISNPRTSAVAISINPNNRVSFLTPQMIWLLSLLLANTSRSAALWPLQAEKVMSANTRSSTVLIFLLIATFLLMIGYLA